MRSRAVAQRRRRAKRPPGEGPGIVRTSVGSARVCAGPGMPALGATRLRVVDEVLRVDEDQVAAFAGAVRTGAPAPACGRPHRARAHELNDARLARGRIDGAGGVAVRAVQQLQVGAVRVDAVQIELVVVDVMFPAREHDAAVRQHRRIEVVALVERDLVDVGAVGVHHVQHERRLVVVLVLGGELRLVLVEQDGLATGAGASRRTRCGRRAGSAARRRGLPPRWCPR